MNKKISLGAAIAFTFIVIAATFSITMSYAERKYNETGANVREQRQNYPQFGELDTIVRQNFAGVIDENKLMESIAKGYIGGLEDPYAAYMNTAAYQKKIAVEGGQTTGIGAVMEMSEDGYLLVTQVYADSPAELAQIEAGDLIVKIDEIDLTRENSMEELEKIQGETGTKVTLVVRKGGAEDVTIDVTRRYVDIPTVSSRLISERVGYIRIDEFGDKTADQFSREISKLTEAGAETFIFDVRDNIGTNMNAALRMLNGLLPEGVLLESVDKNGEAQIVGESDPGFTDIPMVILINGNTQSAAEIFAQVIRDFEKGRIVGVQSAGKGSVQKDFMLTSSGAAVTLTVAEYRLPLGESIEGVGVKPDYLVEMNPDILESWKNLDETTDPQLKKALELALAAVPSQDNGEQPDENSSLSSEEPSSTPPAPSSSNDVSQEEPENSDNSQSSEQSGEEDSDQEE